MLAYILPLKSCNSRDQKAATDLAWQCINTEHNAIAA